MPVGGNFTNCNCGPDTTACENPTQPVSTVGLCLADGSPIAVTVVRDCAGTATSEGWIDLTTGTYSAGPPPAGAMACGGSRSIQVSGTFCDVDPDTGDVLGLVLVEYSYAADGSVESVRLVDAVTGDTYTPQGEVTTCPAGVEQPERDLTQLCDVTDDESGTTLSVPFVRDYQRDENGQITGHTDYTLDGAPYEVTGEVGQCATTGDGASPTSRVDVESDVLCIRDEAGDITGQVVVERVYDDQTGDRTTQRLTDPTTGEEVELPAGAELVLCQEPQCPVAFSTECVGAVTRTEAAYDNTSMIGGLPGKCGSVQGPGGQFPCQPTSGPLTITSWIVDGEEVIGEGGGRSFNGGPCGAGTAANPGMHRNWSAALTNLDPSGATWAADEAEGCAWFVGSTGGTRTVYGAMTVEDAAGQQWILGPAQACEETQYTKVYSQDCDGSVSVSWLDAQGVETEAPEGDLVPCGTGCGGSGGSGLDVEVVQLCDIQADDGTSTPFLRHITYGTTGQVTVVVDTALDGFAPYTPTGVVGVCDRPEPLAVLEECRCDDTDGDGVGETSYVELIAVGEDGALRRIGTYTDDLSGPYTPVSPVPCDNDSDITPVRTVQPHRVQLAPGASWSADQAPTLQSVTATAHGGTGVITTEDGDSTLHTGESVTWSTSREGEYRLLGPLTIAADTGTVTVAYTTSA